ncbi:SprT-like domain-containing protein [Candidatus Woesearchaeota archaeon]|nr:SprT-like domain-containing protein [Candidatus Woesearchaeota archaeon]
MNILYEAYWLLWNNVSYETQVRYSGHFKGLNASITKKGNMITLNLSKKWKQIEKDIQIGLAQVLLCKLLKKKERSQYIELYHYFMKSIHIAIPKTKTEPILEESFNRVNKEYFEGIIEKPNLEWAGNNTRTLGTYDYGTDTIRISRILQEEQLIDYVMHHEMLHKHLKYKHKGHKTRHHTTQFRTKEKEFQNAEECERKLRRVGSIS